jgi:hypothetical protein
MPGCYELDLDALAKALFSLTRPGCEITVGLRFVEGIRGGRLCGYESAG